jgi:hypothetical protein
MDYRSKTVLLSVPSIIGSILFAAATGIAAIWSRSLWLGTMTVFYTITIFMKISVLSRGSISLISKNPGYNSANNYRLFSIRLLIFDIVFGIALIFFHINYFVKEYPGYTIFVTAVYVLIRVGLSVKNMIQARISQSFTTISLRKIDTVKSVVSLLILINALLGRFAHPYSDLTRNLNSAAGAGAFLIILIMSLNGLIESKKARPS